MSQSLKRMLFLSTFLLVLSVLGSGTSRAETPAGAHLRTKNVPPVAPGSPLCRTYL